MSERFDVLLMVAVESAGAGSALERAVYSALPDGDGVKMTAAGQTGTAHYQTGLAEIRAETEVEAVGIVRTAFEGQGMDLVSEQRAPGGDAPLLIFERATESVE